VRRLILGVALAAMVLGPGSPLAGPAMTASAAVGLVASSASVGTRMQSGPLVAYVSHHGPPVLSDMTPRSAMFAGLGGAAGGVGLGMASTHAGRAIARDNGLEDPSGRMAHALAMAYAATVGGRVAASALNGDVPWSRIRPPEAAQRADGAQYVVEVDRPGMTLIYFPFDWEHRDLFLSSNARVIDTASGRAVAKAHCFVRTDHSNDLTHHDLLADNAAALKQLIIRKSDACVAELEAKLHLPALAEPDPAADGKSPYDGNPQARAVYRF